MCKASETSVDDDNRELEELSRALLKGSSAHQNPLNGLFSPQDSIHTEWYESLSLSQNSVSSKLPFDCTGCGKCCQTKGEVYLNPTETRNAASVLNMSIDEFKNSFVAREEDTDDDNKWTVLQQKNVVDSNGQEMTQCVFLNDDMQCSIYEARPLQCSTYPFWPRIMNDIGSWNDEVVLADDEVHDTSNERMKTWSYEGGGCEGMERIEDESSTIDAGVSIDEAVKKLESYKSYKRRFPVNQKFVNIERDLES